jgi:PAS domain S-box-containing protein
MDKKQVLIIEDDQLLRESTTIFLQEEGFSVINAKNGLEGVEKAMENIPDIILCDISMPRMNGYEVYSILNQNSATSFIPFIFLSAKTEKEDIRVGMQMGADDYITKPFDYDELIKTIELRISKREKLINATESGFKALLDSTLTGILIYQNDKIVFTNSKLLKIFGFTKDEIDQINLFDLIEKEYREDVESKVRRCIKGIQSSFNITFKAKCANGSVLNIDCWGALSNINGQNALIANMININEYRDTAEAKRIESKNLYLKEKIENSASLKDEKHDGIEPNNPDGLTNREIEILQLICQGLTNQEIADMLFLSVRTVDTHRGNLLSKTGVANTAGLVVYAIRNYLYQLNSKH